MHFFCCTALQEIILPSSLTRIGDSAFDYCTALEKIDLPEGLAGIGAWAFEYSGLREIVLPDRLQQVGEGAFAQCMHLEKVEIPEKLLVGLQLYDVFYHTPFYKNNYEGVWKFLPDGTVEMWASLREFVHLAGRWPQPIFLHCAGSLFCEGDPAFFEPAGPKERKQMEESLQKIVTLELYGSSVPAWQFCRCSNLKRLILPRDLEQIEEGAFAHCTALEELVIPDELIYIGPKAFLGCSSLRHVQMAEPLLKRLDDSVFEGTPFWQSPTLRRQARRRSDALLVFLGHAAGNTAAALCKRMNCRQDMLLLGSAVGPLRIHADDCAQAVLCAPVPVPQKPRIYAIQLGKTFLNGRNAGGCPEWGIQALREAKDEVCALLRQYQRVIVVTNPAGGTGSSVTLLAQWLRKMGISHTIIAGTPFAFEGRRRMGVAQSALNELRGSPLIEVPYEEIMQRAENEEIKVTLKNAFDLADQEVCRRLEQLLAQNGLQ